MFSDEDKEELLRRARHVVLQGKLSYAGWHDFKYGALDVTFNSVIAGVRESSGGLLCVYVNNWPVVDHMTRVLDSPKTTWRWKSEDRGPEALDLLRKAMALDDLADV
jgi:hypothetical protein